MGLSGERVRNVIAALQALYRRNRRKVHVDPTLDLDLPAPGGSRVWTRPISDVAALIKAAPADDRAIWASAFYAGPRLGELRALRTRDVDLASKVEIDERQGNIVRKVERNAHSINIVHGWHARAGQIAPKSQAGVRPIPVAEILRVELAAHIERTRRSGDELLFGRSPTLPFTQTRVQHDADEVWRTAGLERVTFHDGRHFLKSLMDHAGISESRSDRYLGHSDGRVANNYRHLLPGQLAEDAKTLDEFLAGTKSRKVVPFDAERRSA